MNRREFLKISVVGAVAVAAPVGLLDSLLHRVPIIYGDGIHDDTDGLQAALSGKPFIARRNCVRVEDRSVQLMGGVYSVGRTLEVTQPHTMIGGGAKLIARPELRGPMLQINDSARQSIFDGFELWGNNHPDQVGMRFGASVRVPKNFEDLF